MMSDYAELKPDSETFARVWKRVMPDERLSQIVLHTQEEGAGAVQNVPSVPEREGDEVRLRPVLEALDEGVAGVEAILRRQPGAWPLRDEMRKSAAQFRAAWLLAAGQPWRKGSQGQGSRGELTRLLREQYQCELRFSQLCREAEAGYIDRIHLSSSLEFGFI